MVVVVVFIQLAGQVLAVSHCHEEPPDSASHSAEFPPTGTCLWFVGKITLGGQLLTVRYSMVPPSVQPVVAMARRWYSMRYCWLAALTVSWWKGVAAAADGRGYHWLVAVNRVAKRQR